MATASNEATVIGESILINGTLTGDEDLRILGRVDGAINLTQTLEVAESGIVRAEVQVRDAVISGILVGDVTATQSVHVTETGRLKGNIKAHQVIVRRGARVSGEIIMDADEAPEKHSALPERRSASFSKPASRPALPPKRASATVPSAPSRSLGEPVAVKATLPARPTNNLAAKKIKRKVVVKRKG